MITNESSLADRNAPTMMSSLFISVTSREGGDRVCPGVDLCKDHVIRVGGDRDLVSGEVDEVQLAVRVVTLVCCRVRVFLRVVDDRASVRGRKSVSAMRWAIPALKPSIVFSRLKIIIPTKLIFDSGSII